MGKCNRERHRGAFGALHNNALNPARFFVFCGAPDRAAVRVLFSDCLRAPKHVPVRVFLVSFFVHQIVSFSFLYDSLNRVLIHFFRIFPVHEIISDFVPL